MWGVYTNTFDSEIPALCTRCSDCSDSLPNRPFGTSRFRAPEVQDLSLR